MHLKSHFWTPRVMGNIEVLSGSGRTFGGASCKVQLVQLTGA